MRILFFIDGVRSGGKERQLAALMKGLAALKAPRVQMALAVMNSDIYYREVLALGAEVFYLERESKRDWAPARRLTALCRAWKPDILHAWDSLTAMYALPAVLLTRVPFICGSIRHAAVPRFPRKFWWVSHLTFPAARRVVSNSLAGLAAHGQIPSRKYRCIVNGYDPARASNPASVSETRLRLGLTAPKAVGMVANFEDRKDYQTFVAAAVRILEKRQDTQFIAVGDGKNFQSIQDSVPPAFRDQILFPGRQKDVESIVAALDVACLINNTRGHGEGVSNAIMEYMALGKPVIATDSGGNKEIVGDGETGYIIKPFDVADLVEKINRLLDDRDLAFRMGEAGRRRLHGEFGLERMVQNYLDLYRELVPSSQEPPESAREGLNIALMGDVALHGLFSEQPGLNRERLAAIPPLLEDADLVLANLETPVLDETQGDWAKKEKMGVLLGAKAPVISEILPMLRISAVSLANNHIYDYGRAGADQTISLLNTLGIARTGAGSEPRDLEPVCLEKNGLKVIFMAWVHRDTHPLMEEKPGIRLNLFDESAVVRAIEAARQPGVLIVVSVHWGVDYSFYPSFEQQAVYRRLADCGADVVMGHHPHTVQPFEIYKGRYIFYSLGGLCFGDFVYKGKLRALKRKTKRSILPVLNWRPGADPALNAVHCYSLKELAGNRVVLKKRSLLPFLVRKRRFMNWRRFKPFALAVRLKESFWDRLMEYFFGYYRNPLAQLFSLQNFSKIRYGLRDYTQRRNK